MVNTRWGGEPRGASPEASRARWSLRDGFSRAMPRRGNSVVRLVTRSWTSNAARLGAGSEVPNQQSRRRTRPVVRLDRRPSTAGFRVPRLQRMRFRRVLMPQGPLSLPDCPTGCIGPSQSPERGPAHIDREIRSRTSRPLCRKRRNRPEVHQSLHACYKSLNVLAG